MGQSDPQTLGLRVEQAIAAKRAVRNYRGEPVPAPIIHAILNAGRRAQSSKNSQPWVFVVVKEREQLQRLASAGLYAKHVASSAFTVVLVAPETSEFDIGQASAYLQLAAVEYGVGSCVIVLHDHEAARAILGVPPELSCRWAITFGYPADAPHAPKVGGRKPLADIIRSERY